MSEDFDWTPAAEQRLREMWDAGASMSSIAHAIGVSKNSVVGKKARLGLAPRPSPIKPPKAEADPEATRTPRGTGGRWSIAPSAATLPPLASTHEPASAAPQLPGRPIQLSPASERRRRHPAPTPIGALVRQCEWLEGSAPPYAQCQGRTVPGKSWCPQHYARVFVRPSAAVD